MTVGACDVWVPLKMHNVTMPYQLHICIFIVRKESGVSGVAAWLMTIKSTPPAASSKFASLEE